MRRLGKSAGGTITRVGVTCSGNGGSGNFWTPEQKAILDEHHESLGDGESELLANRGGGRRVSGSGSRMQPLINASVNRLIRQIREIDPKASVSTMRPSSGPGSEYTLSDVRYYEQMLAGLRGPSPTFDFRTGREVGRFIVDSNGNTLIEPVGGRTVPAGRRGEDTHTLYPNGSNYQRLNPNGHGPNNPRPHSHGHLEGTGPGIRGQGSSLDPSGNIVPWNSADAHWPIK